MASRCASSRTPWAWIKCLRDLTNYPTSNNTTPNKNSDIPDLPVAILPWLYLGDRKSAMNISKLQQLKITHVLSTHAAFPREVAYYQERLAENVPHIVHQRVYCDDTEGYDMIGRHWKECYDFFQDALRHTNDDEVRILVHCVAGINRSGLIVCAAYMIFEQQPLISTVQHCLSCRGGMLLWNRSFQRQLVDLAQSENLLGPKPEGYTDDPLPEEKDAEDYVPAHEALGIQVVQYRLSPHLGRKLRQQQQQNNEISDC